MSEYEIVDANAGNIGECGFFGYRAGSNPGHRRKTYWLKERYPKGLRFKVLHSVRFADMGMIE